MVEVFKTNVKNRYQAKLVILNLQQAFPEYEANFDMEDCDKILRIESKGNIHIPELIKFLISCRIHIEILPDSIPEEYQINECYYN